jgi:zinc transporter, ZIP family
MGGALFWGLVGASSLIVGGAFALRFRISQRSLGLVMGFGSGVLISAVAYELALEAFETSAHTWHVAAGLFAGSFTFFVGDAVIDRLGGEDRKDSDGAQAGGSALAIVLGTVLDGIPESAVIGLGLLQGAGVSAAFVVAVFVSNVPEAIAATTGLARSGWAGERSSASGSRSPSSPAWRRSPAMPSSTERAPAWSRSSSRSRAAPS